MRKKHLIIIISIFLGLLSVPAMAANRTFTVKADNGDYGQVSYRVGSGSWSSFAASHSVTAADGATVTVVARVKTGNTAYGFSRWDARTVEDKPKYYSAQAEFNLTVTSDFGGKTITAYFNAWTENLIAGATYTLTSTNGNSFKVTCTNTTSPCHNNTYAFIGNVTVTSGTVKMVYNTNTYLLQTGTIHVKKGKLEMGFGSNATFAADRPTIKRAWGNTKTPLVLVRPAPRAEGAPANVYTDYGLTISGKASDDMSKNFVICGQYATARMDSTLLAGSDGVYTDYHLVKGDNDMLIENGGGVLVYLDGGIVDFDYVTVEKDWNTQAPSGIFFGGNGAVEGNKIKLEAELDHCLLQWLYGYCYGGACKVDNYVRGSWVKMIDCEIRYCENGTNNNPEMNSSSGGAIRSSGNNLCSLTMTRCDVHHNCTPARGGGIRWNAAMINPSLVLNNCKIRRNWAGEFGGGLRVEGQADVTGCSFIGNRAEKSGGGLSLGPFTTGGPAHLYVGGGVWFPKDCSISLDSDSKIENNTAAEYGGGIYINVEFTTLEGGTNNGQTFDPWTVYLNDQYEQYKGVLEMNGASVKNNTAGIDGGAVYMTRNTNYYGLVTDLNSGTISNNTAVGNGGAVCLAENITEPVSPNPTIFEYNGTTYNLVPQNIIANLGKSGGTDPLTITKNTSVNGGGLYVENGNVSVYGNALVGGSTANANKSIGGNGGAVYITGGNLHMYAGEISYNEATKIGNNGGNGGGTFVSGGDVTVESGNINYNKAGDQGGGLYSSGVINFSDGSISNNKATQNGGGIYIPATGTLNISGTAALTGNNVTNGQGGGIYLGGTMTADGESLTVSGNTKGTAKAISKNNVYLPDGKTIKVLGSIDPTGVNLGIYTQNEAVEGGADIPVLTADAANVSKLEAIYNALLDGSSQITDDREVHKAKYPGADATGKTLYFTKISYDFGVFSDSEPFSNPINSPLQLYKYMCWVNGLNGFSTKHAGAEGIVTADINMFGVTHWIPIGEKETSSTDTDPFNGTFNGNGYVISNLSLTGIDDYTNYGLFGNITTNAIITDVNVQGCNFTKNEGGAMGTIVGLMQGGTVKNSIGSGSLNAAHADCIIGGLVGKKTGGTIHSSAAMADMTGYQMGGLAGDLASGCSIYNSFANGRFTAQTGSDKYIGGLVGVNKGKVENCYSLVRGTVPSTTYFGWLAGNNTSETNMGLYCCYAPNSTYVATVSGTTQGNKSGLTTFGTTQTPYLYKHADNKVATVADNSYITNGALDRNGLKGLLATLNNWVKAHSGNDFSKWMRTSGSSINGDYPIHNYTDYVCVGSPDNIVLEYSDDFNKKFAKLLACNNNAGVGTIYLYNSPTAAVADTLSNNSKATELYIHEDVVMLHSTAIKAHVGITLDNSAGTIGAHPSFSNNQDAIDWHFFSSALADAPIGLTYGDEIQHVLGEYPSWHATFTNANGYFPTNLNDVVGGDDYYEHWDLYGYYEPDYHWVNYKRNSASHWHEDWPDIPIPYTNDTEFVPGKGYMVALKDEGYLQAYGTLNTNTGVGSDSLSVPVTCTSSIGWTTREGHNLLGNPYQSYLDFDAFVRKNESLWKEGRDPFYIIMDEDNKGYVLYTVGQSTNSEQASRFLHPHQGFMIDSDVKGWARFDNGMRTTSTTVTTGDSPVTWEGHFRGEETPCYPLVNLMATDANGNRDIVTVELGRPDKGGALKQDAMHSGKGSLWCRYEDEDYALVFTQPGLEYANIRFAADEDAEFTMTWSTHNGEFSYLHLIDNMTGADIDCLSESEYTFSARESDYNSRFRLVFDYTGIEENEDGTSAGSATFAYYANGEIHLTDAQADASLQIIDMTGRTIVSRDGVHTVSTTGMAAGVYVLRLTDGNGTRTQKIILN